MMTLKKIKYLEINSTRSIKIHLKQKLNASEASKRKLKK